MKTKTLLITLSFIGFLSLSLISCSKDGDMGVGGTAGNDPHGAVKSTHSQPVDSIAIAGLPKD